MASANTVEIRQPIVTVPGELTDSVSFASVCPGANRMPPSVSYSAHKAGSDRIESPTSKELIQKIADAQNTMFQPPVENVVNMLDGAGNFAMFRGYAAGPNHTIAFNNVRNGKSLVHRCSKLNFLNTSIYRPGLGIPVAEAAPVIQGAANPCAALKLILENIIRDFIEVDPEDKGTTDYKIRQKIHEANTKILNEEWYPILDASTESSISNFSDATNNPTIQIKMYDIIRSYYLNSDDFSSTISAFEALFQMVFVPGHMGNTPGKFVPLTNIISNPEDKDVNIVSLDMNPGPKTYLSVTAVAVKGLPPEEPPVGQAAVPAGTDMICWPEELPASGLTQVIQMPAWLPSDLYPLEILKTGDNLDANANYNKAEAAQKEIKDGTELVRKICLDIARTTYIYSALEKSEATIISPLDLTWEAGKRYTVKQPDSKSGGSSALFAGWLCRLEHRITSTPGSPQAFTTLTFSHVEATGFTLPNK